MSGDVQPRKRREKKKKKEDATEEAVFQQQHPATTSPIVTDDLNIHIQKEASTGGGLCAKFVFFILLTALTTLIGLIITEHRGLTDLDTIDTESRFAQLFEGWIDAPSIGHESGEELSTEQSEEQAYEQEEEDHEEEEDDDEQDQSLDHDDDEEDEEVSEEQATDENATDEETYEEESELQDTIENESEEMSNETDDENEEEVEEDEDEQEEDEDEEEEPEYASEDEEISDGDRDASSLPTKEEVTQEDEEESTEAKDEDSEEAVDKTAETEESKDLAESEETADLTESEEAADDQPESEETADRTESEEAVSSDDVDEVATKETDEEHTIEKKDDTSKNAKINAESKEEIVTKVRQAKRAEPEKKKSAEVSEDTDAPQEMDNYNMAIKFGVGTALLVVAHVVLVQKWRNEEKISTKKPQDTPEEAETVTPDLSRRNTIVTPPSLQEIEQDIENVEEEYSEDGDYDSDDDSRSKPTRAKMRYQELQSTYSHTLSPEWEPKEVRENRDKNYEEEEEEEEEPDGDEEDYDDEISENEDAELLKRLEAKYGIIRHSDEEPDDDGDDDDENDEEEDDEEGELEEDRDDDFDSWKRVKVPSGNVPEDSDSENEKQWSKQGSGAQAVYDFENITNSNDYQVREELDRAQQNLANDAAYALTLFNKILERYPSSPRAIYGKAQSLDILAEEKRSNNLLQQAIASYEQVLKVKEVPDALFQMAAERCIDRIRFRGLYGHAIPIHRLLIEKFPNEAKFANHLAVTYLTTNKINEARKILHETLLKWPNDGFALVHYGFILKTNDNNLEGAVEYLQKGIDTKQPGVIDGRFYFHLGDALTRLGRKEEAMSVYSDGVVNKVFLSKYQRSLYNVERLTGKPWWEKEETPYVLLFEQLEQNWKIIRDEGLSILNQKGYFQPESENLRDVGEWKQFELYARGIKNSKNCKQCPNTCKIVEILPDAIGCRRGQIKFSVMHPSTHVWPHCGPTNCRLRTHLGLKVPSNTYIRVGKEIRSWEEGKLLIFDDSFEHEVWHNGTATRLVLIIDIWHPELTRREKQSLSSI